MITSKLNLNHELYVKECNVPDIQDEQLLIKVLSCAICGSDLKITKFGNTRITEERTIGHEIAGEIVSIGAKVKGFEIGEKISIGADLPCHECSFCNNGFVNLCSKNLAIGYQFDGGFSQYMVVNKFVLQDGPVCKFCNVDPDLACLAEPLACAINGVDKAMQCFNLGKPKNSLIFGGGPMGLLIAEYLNYRKVFDITIIEPNKDRESFIKDNTQFNTLPKISSENKKFDLIFTACPVFETHELSLKLVSSSGVINFFGGLPSVSEKLNLSSNEIHYKEIVLMGTHGSTPFFHEKALKLIETYEIDLRYLITHKFSLNELELAFETARSGKGQKIIINPNE